MRTEPLPPTGGTRVLFLGDLAGTGFGSVTRDLSREMVKRGMDLRVISTNEQTDTQIDPTLPRELHGRTIMLGGSWTGEGREAVGIVAKAMGIFTGATVPGWKPDVVLVLGDHGSLERSPWIELVPPDLPAFHYTPIEGVGLAPSWAKLWQRFTPIAVTESGADEIEKVTGTRPPVVYHGIDPESFWQVSAARPLVMRTRKGEHVLRSRTDCRAFLGWPQGATILFRADRLMPRKAYPAMFRAIAPVLAAHKDVVMYIHCLTKDQGGDLWHESSKYPDFIRARIGSTGFHDTMGGAPRELLTCMYNAADLYISTSAEGFGLTVAESLACGVPAVALDYSSLPEVVGPAGILVDDIALIDNIYSYYWAIPKGPGYTAAVERLVTDRDERMRLGRLGPPHVAQFDWGIAAERMDAILSGTPIPAASVPTERKMQALGLVRA